MILLLPFASTGQKNKALTIGDKVPDISFSPILNAPVQSSSLAAFKNKLLILDFMATSCGSCISYLPKLDSLQKRYKDRMQIILVSPEKRDRINAFLKKHPHLKLPFVANDTTLTKLFPHVYISHIAWINPENRVCAITHPEYITSQNIQSVLNGKIVNWPIKREFPAYDFNQPILELNTKNIPKEVLPHRYYYTALVNYMPGIGKMYKVVFDSATHVVHTTLINYTILDLYRILFNRYRLPLTHIIPDVKNKERLFYNIDDGYYETWKTKNMYCIEASLPSDIPLDQQRQKLIKELDFYFGFHTHLETKTVNCLILKNYNEIFKTKQNAGRNGLSPAGIAGILNENLNSPPVIDETNGMLRFKLPITEEEVNNSAYLHKILQEYGLELNVEKRPIEFMIITDSTDPHPITNSQKH